jgi:hypothetical protein
MTGRSSINAGVFIQKSFKGGGRNCRWRTPSGFPLLQGGQLGGHASRNESIYCLGLAQIIGLPPSLQTENDSSGTLLRRGRFVSLGKESFKRRSGDRLRSGLPYFPGLERAQFDRQSGGNQSLDRLRLTEFVQGSPGFQFSDYGREAAVSGHQRSMMPMAQNAGNSQSRKFFGTADFGAIYNKVRYRLRHITGQEGTRRSRRERPTFSMEKAEMAIGATAANE